MEYNRANNIHCMLRLTTGREIALKALTQSQTYEGMLEGTPAQRSNDRRIEWALTYVRELCSSIGEPCLVSPARRAFRKEPGDMDQVLEMQRELPPEIRRIPEWLPEVRCIGMFESFSPARDQTMDASSLTVVWFQDEFGIDSDALARICEIDWDQYAVDWSF
jgi:hypothetical protein